MPHIDFETRSAADLKEVGLHNYARHPSTEPWCMAWALGDEDPELWTLGQPLPQPLREAVERGDTIVAHNAPFELEIWNEIMVSRAGWPALLPTQTVCTMAQAYAMGLPGALEDAAMAVGLDVQKDMEGRALVLRMARPRAVQPNGTIIWWDDQERLDRGHAYCRQDVRVERALHHRLMPLSKTERAVWMMDYRINKRGMFIDVDSALASIELEAQAKEDCNNRLAIITGFQVQTVNALIPFKQWLKSRCPQLDWESLSKEDVTDALAIADLPDDVRAALTLRQQAGKASTAKLKPMVAIAGADHRMRGTMQYHGATTGRWAGRKIQPHNFPRDSHAEKDAEIILRWIREGQAAAVEMVYEQPLAAISRCLKAYITAAPGKLLCAGDYSAIEGRGTAWISGEEWKLDVFRAFDAGLGPDIYKMTASKLLNIRVEDVTPEQRQKPGKTAELAFGYQGGVGAARRFGATEPDEVVDGWKNDWREAHPNIKGMWALLQGAAMSAVRDEGKVYAAGNKFNAVRFKKAGSFLWALLPSGRALCYPYPEIRVGDFGSQLTYMAVPSPDDRKLGRVLPDPNNAPRWARLSTYGGSLMENVVQAICRDILAHAMLRLEAAGFNIVLHVHDEIVCEESSDRSAEMQAIASEVPAWAAGFPISIKCHPMRRYGK